MPNSVGSKGTVGKITATVAIDMIRFFRIGIDSSRSIGGGYSGGSVIQSIPLRTVRQYSFIFSRAGKHAAHADDGYRLLRQMRIGCHFLCFIVVMLGVG
jgi:hypothetical protein